MGRGQQAGLPGSGVGHRFSFLHLDDAVSPCSLAFNSPYSITWCKSGYIRPPDLASFRCRDEKLGWQLLGTQFDLDLSLWCFPRATLVHDIPHHLSQEMAL